MRFLADMGVSHSVVRALRMLGHDAIHLRDGGFMRMEDGDIVVKARTEDRIVLTLDLDFGELMARAGTSTPSIVLFRTSIQTAAFITPRLLRVIAECEAQLTAGAIVTVENGRYRVRNLPIGAATPRFL